MQYVYSFMIYKNEKILSSSSGLHTFNCDSGPMGVRIFIGDPSEKSGPRRGFILGESVFILACHFMNACKSSVSRFYHNDVICCIALLKKPAEGRIEGRGIKHQAQLNHFSCEGGGFQHNIKEAVVNFSIHLSD